MAESELQMCFFRRLAEATPLVHFPVALLMVAAASELGGLWRRSPEVGAMAGGGLVRSPRNFCCRIRRLDHVERDPVLGRWPQLGVASLDRSWCSRFDTLCVC